MILVKLSHYRNQFSKDVPSKYLNNDLFLMLAEYLKINPFKTLNLFDNYPRHFKNEIRNYFKELIAERDNNFYEIFERNELNDDPFVWRERLYNRIVEFFESRQDQTINIQFDIPSKYTFNLDSEKEIEFDLIAEHNLSLLVF